MYTVVVVARAHVDESSACDMHKTHPFRHNISRGHLDTPPQIFLIQKMSLATGITTNMPWNIRQYVHVMTTKFSVRLSARRHGSKSSP